MSENKSDVVKIGEQEKEPNGSQSFNNSQKAIILSLINSGIKAQGIAIASNNNLLNLHFALIKLQGVFESQDKE